MWNVQCDGVDVATALHPGTVGDAGEELHPGDSIAGMSLRQAAAFGRVVGPHSGAGVPVGNTVGNLDK